MDLNDDLPVYTISVVAKLFKVHPQTLRSYEAEGLISPQKEGGKRLYSKNDLTGIKCLRKMIHDDKISIPGIKKLLEFIPCWKIIDCPKEIHTKCREIRNKQKVF